MRNRTVTSIHCRLATPHTISKLNSLSDSRQPNYGNLAIESPFSIGNIMHKPHEKQMDKALDSFFSSDKHERQARSCLFRCSFREQCSRKLHGRCYLLPSSTALRKKVCADLSQSGKDSLHAKQDITTQRSS